MDGITLQLISQAIAPVSDLALVYIAYIVFRVERRVMRLELYVNTMDKKAPD